MSSVRINNVSVKKGDIVQVKFKKIEDILSFYKEHKFRINDVFSQTQLGDHLVSLTRGGLFHVDSVDDEDLCLPEVNQHLRRTKDYVRPTEITLNDHNNDNYDMFTVNEHLIESIEVMEDAGDRYFSDKFNLSLVKIDGTLIINGVSLGKEDKDLISILEKTIADMSIRSMLESNDESEKEDR